MNSTAYKLAAHVPAELYWDHDLDSFPEQFDDPYEACTAIHQGPDVIWARGAYRGNPGWVMTRFAHLQEVAMDHVRFSPSDNRDASGFLGFDLKLLPFEADPPDHTFYRLLVQRGFQPSAVRALESSITNACSELIDNFQSRNGCEFVSEFSSFLPSRIFLQLMGMPIEKLQQFLEWENGFMRGPTLEVRRHATQSIYNYFKEYLAQCRRNPKNDLVSHIATGAVNGRKLTDDEAIGTCVLLYIGGLDTVKSSLGWYVRHLALNPDLQERLRSEPQLIATAVNELLRAYGVTTNGRKVVADTEFHGVQMRRGDIVALPSFLSARDPRAYVEPHRVDIDRKNAAHMTLGTGIHLCQGHVLAKTEMRIVLEQFLKRFRNIRLPKQADIRWTSRGVWGFQRLPLAWD
jgi:cytochrome P450